MLMGDNWIKTIFRVVTPNAASTLIEVFGYYFVNAMVTISAVIFIAGARTMVLTTKIKELQYYNKFNEVFVLSLLILATNLTAKLVIGLLSDVNKVKEFKEKIKMKKLIYKIGTVLMSVAILCSGLGLTACGTSGEKQVVIYSNADDEAIIAMKDTLDANGYSGKYLFQTFGTSELGGKLMTEGKNIEADLITMSSFYIDSAQEKNNMFLDLDFPQKTLEQYPSYYTPITAQEGALIVNTEMMKENNLPTPKSIKDLANPEYKGFISVTDIEGSSTAWLMIQALISSYGEDQTKEILKKIYENAGPHLEDSGPHKKVRAGEVAIGFGLRHQAIADKNNGLPIDYVDPTEGNYVLTESLALINKDGKENPLASEMADCIINKGRTELIKTYPMALYEGESTNGNSVSGNTKVFAEKLTVDLLDKHKKLSNECKGAN